MLRTTLSTITIFLSLTLFSQSIGDLGLPFITNFARKDYDAGTQNWCVEQDANQVMWFGNNNMLIWHDGVEWGKVSISNFSVARSLKSTLKKQLLVGAFQEFGEIKKAPDGQYYYKSWLDLLPNKYHNFSDILKIHELNGEYYFQSDEYIFVFKDGEFQRVYEPETSFIFSFLANNRLYVAEKQLGLKQLMSDGLRMVGNGRFFADKGIWFLDYFKGKLLAITQTQGMFLYSNGRWKSWDCPANEFLKKNSFYTGLKNNRKQLILGTVQNGLLICDENGEIKKHINKRRGLYNNTVLSMTIDQEQNLWLGLDHGISYLKINSPFSQLFNENGFGTGYTSVYANKTLYLGTNQGLYYRQISADPLSDYQPIEGSQGQVWNLQEFNGTLFCSQHNGLYYVQDRSIIKVKDTDGCWKLLPHPTMPDTYIVGTYLGFGVLRGKQGEFTFEKLDGFEESSRIMAFDAYNNLWMSHGYKGVYKITLNEEVTAIDRVKFFGTAEGLPSESNNEIFKFNDQIAVAAIDKVYTYNRASGKMEPYKEWNDFYPLHTQITKIFSNTSNSSYLFSDGKLHKAAFQKGSLYEFDSNLFLPLKGSFLTAFENITFISDDLFVIGVADGFVLYDGSMGTNNRFNLPLNIKQITCGNKSTFNYTSDTLDITKEIIEVPYSNRNLLIKYATPLYEKQSNIKKEISINGELITAQMTEDYNIELNELDFGNYTLDIKVSDISGRQLAAHSSINFKVLPPWYLTWYVVVAWILIFIAILSISYLYTKKRIDRIKRKEKIFQERKMIKEQIALRRKADKAEQQMTQLRNETLQKKNRHKTEEIANSTMELVEKNKMLLTVKDKLKNIQSEKDIDTRNSIIRQMLKTIDRDLNNKEKWKIFEENFDEVHEDFLNRFKEKHPNITAKDMRLCAFLRMNLSSKEIAPLLSISIRSVEISRYRLRKKIELSHEINLTDYIVHF